MKLLKKKIELAIRFLQKYDNLFRCPNCFTNISTDLTDNSLKCENGHTFNVSKKGSVQLVNKFIKSDYNEKLFDSRSKMMEFGLFNPVFESLSNNIYDGDLVVDAGSGEGSALIDIAQKKKIIGLGFDLSNEGVQLSTRGLSENSDVFFAVSNLANIPLKDSNIDVIVNLLSPANYDEFNRILKNDGEILKVIPGINYLKEIRKFASTKDNHIQSEYDNKDVVNNLKSRFKNIKIENINYNFSIDTRELKENMFSMTPLTWNLDQNMKSEFIKSSINNITVDLQLLKIIN